MNKFVKGLLLSVVAAVVLSGCILEPNSELQLEYYVVSVSHTTLPGDIVITYYVDNEGDFDIPDLRFYFEADYDNNSSIDASGWSSEFYLSSGSSTTRSVTLNCTASSKAALDDTQLVLITGIGMDNPSDE